MKLYNSDAGNPRRVRIFIAEKDIDIPTVTLDLGKGDTRTAEFLKLNSLGETPVLELDDGTILTESMAICRYLEALHPAKPLLGENPLQQATIEMWNRRIEQRIFDTVGAVVRHTIPFFADKMTQVPAFAAAQKEAMPAVWKWLDEEISDGRPFIAGDTFSVADITCMVSCRISAFFKMGIPENLENLSNWQTAMQARASWDA